MGDFPRVLSTFVLKFRLAVHRVTGGVVRFSEMGCYWSYPCHHGTFFQVDDTHGKPIALWLVRADIVKAAAIDRAANLSGDKNGPES